MEFCYTLGLLLLGSWFYQCGLNVLVSTTLQRDAKDVRLDDIPPNGLIEKYFNKRENLDQYEDHPSQRMNELSPEERNVWRDLSKLEKYHKLHYVKRLRPNEEDSTKELVGAERLAEPIPENSSPLRNIDNELDLRVANYITNYLRSEGLSAGAEDVLDRDEDLPEPQRRFIARLAFRILSRVLRHLLPYLLRVVFG
ncbi:hypothetical protein BSL78_18686 [Apostichopus japonicus]|uniref:Uncharacterized protein n=1 Tax=Stichopus japonicus TaxID=307972 RepID=A0A2G8K8Y4_STIJA|nr:hypothetical protein BSL78_18686 [Apostichopus japonicus]